MTLADEGFNIDGIECAEALYLYDADDGRHAMAYTRLLEDDWNDATGYCWCTTTYVFEDGEWSEYGGDRLWDYDRADELAPADLDLSYDIAGSATVYLYTGAAADDLYEDLLNNQRDFDGADLSLAEETI